MCFVSISLIISSLQLELLRREKVQDFLLESTERRGESVCKMMKGKAEVHVAIVSHRRLLASHQQFYQGTEIHASIWLPVVLDEAK